MPVRRTGLPITIDQSANSGSQAVVIPDDANCVVFSVIGYVTNGNTSYTTNGVITLNGITIPFQVVAEIGDDFSAIYVLASSTLPIGTQTLAWNFEGSASFADGGRLVIACYKGVDVSAPVRDTDAVMAPTSSPSTATLTTGTLTVVYGDAVICAAYIYDNNPNPDSVTWTNAVELTGSLYNLSYNSVAEAFPSGNTTITLNPNNNDGNNLWLTIATVVLRAAPYEEPPKSKFSTASKLALLRSNTILTRQPQGPVEIAWSNPLSNRLYIAFDARQNRELVRNVSGSYGAAGTRVTKHGVGRNVVSANVLSGAETIPTLPLSGIVLTKAISWGGSHQVYLKHGTGGSIGYAFYLEPTDRKLYWVHYGVAEYISTNAIWDGVSTDDSLTRVLGFTDNGSTVTFYDNGAVIGSASVGALIGGSDTINALYSLAGTSTGSAEYIAFAWKRALSTRDHLELSQNPWQLFRPYKPRTYSLGNYVARSNQRVPFIPKSIPKLGSIRSVYVSPTNSDYVTRTTNGLNHNLSYTWMGWVTLVKNNSEWGHIYVVLGDTTNNYANADYIGINADGLALSFSCYVSGLGGSTNASISLVVSAPIHLTLVRISATDLRLYVNGIQAGATDTRNVSGRSSTKYEMLGQLWNYPGPVSIENMKQWSVGLTQSEIVREMKSFTVSKKIGLYAWNPTCGNSVKELLMDHSGYNRHWNAVGNVISQKSYATGKQVLNDARCLIFHSIASSQQTKLLITR